MILKYSTVPLRFIYILLFFASYCYGCDDNEFKAFGRCFKRKYFKESDIQVIQKCSVPSNLDKRPCQVGVIAMEFLLKQHETSFKFPFIENASEIYKKMQQLIDNKVCAIQIHQRSVGSFLGRIDKEDIGVFEKYYSRGTLPLVQELHPFDQEKAVEDIKQCRNFATNKKVCLLWVARINQLEWNHENRKCDLKTSTLNMWRNVRDQIEESLSLVKKLKKKLRDAE